MYGEVESWLASGMKKKDFIQTRPLDTPLTYGAERSAMFFSFFAYCQLNNIDPKKWMD